MTDISAAQAGTIQIGDLTVNRLGLGTNRITDIPEARALLQRAVELGVNFIDTAYKYQNGASEQTIGNTLAPYADGLAVATKGGWDDIYPSQYRHMLEISLERLKTDSIVLYQLHRLNPTVSVEECISVYKQFQDEGKIRHIGLSEVTVAELEQARKVAPIASVQNEYNVANRKHEELVDYCTREGIIFIPWFPLGGLAGDTVKVEAVVRDMAQKYQTGPQQIALAWLLKRSPMILPIPGTLSIEHLEANVQAATLELSDEDYQTLSNS